MKLSVLFNVEKPTQLIFSKQTLDVNGINFVSSSAQNNGVVDKVKQNPNNKLYQKESITVPLKGSVLSAFIQPNDFYCAHQIAILTPIKPMSLKTKQFYCLCIRKNIYRYNFGRQADNSLECIELPDKIPDWLKQVTIPEINGFSDSFTSPILKIIKENWKSFRYDDKRLFKIEIGRGEYKQNIVKNGKIPYITARDNNNGLTGKFDMIPKHDGNVISVNRDGNGVGEAFYQPMPFCSTEAVHVFVPQFKLNPFIAMFLICLIRLEKFKYNYGRKWGIDRMNKSTIKLPVDKNGDPDWQFMEDYIKSLPSSKNLETSNEISP